MDSPASSTPGSPRQSFVNDVSSARSCAPAAVTLRPLETSRCCRLLSCASCLHTQGHCGIRLTLMAIDVSLLALAMCCMVLEKLSSSIGCSASSLVCRLSWSNDGRRNRKGMACTRAEAGASRCIMTLTFLSCVSCGARLPNSCRAVSAQCHTVRCCSFCKRCSMVASGGCSPYADT